MSSSSGFCSHREKIYRIMALRPALSWRPNCRWSMVIGGSWKRSSLTWSTTRSKQWTLRRIAIGYCGRELSSVIMMRLLWQYGVRDLELIHNGWTAYLAYLLRRSPMAWAWD